MNNPAFSVLIIDDDAAIRQSFGDYFEDQDFTVLSAESGEEALEILMTESPNAAIVDVRMKGMSGVDFIQNAYPQKLDCVFLICTGSPEYRLPDDLLKLNRVSSTVFQKPVKNLSLVYKEILQMFLK